MTVLYGVALYASVGHATSALSLPGKPACPDLRGCSACVACSQGPTASEECFGPLSVSLLASHSVGIDGHGGVADSPRSVVGLVDHWTNSIMSDALVLVLG